MYLDTANAKSILDAYQTNVFKGVTTNPTILHKEGKNRFETLKEIAKLQVGELFCQVVGATCDERWIDYLSIREFSQDEQIPIIVKVPIDDIGLRLIKRIKEVYPEQRILATAVYSSEQGILSAIAGCDYIAPYVNRMESHGIDPFKEIATIRSFIEQRSLSTIIMAASFKQKNQVIKALSSGAHTCTISFEIFQMLSHNQLASDAIDVFNMHGNQIKQ